MNKEIKEKLIKATTDHLKHILHIANCKDSNFYKLEAIKLYCGNSLKAINKVIKDHLENE